MKFMRIKWENIFGIIMAVSLTAMTIKYIRLYGFDFTVLVADLSYVVVSTLGVMYCLKKSRQMYLKDDK